MADLFEADAIVGRSPGVLQRRVLDGLLLLGREMSEPLHLSSPGDVVWAIIAEPLRLADLIDVVAETYATAQDTIKVELEPILEHLEAVGVIEITAPIP